MFLFTVPFRDKITRKESQQNVFSMKTNNVVFKKIIIHNDFTKLSYTQICAKMKVRERIIKVEEDNLYAAYDQKFCNRQEKKIENMLNVYVMSYCFQSVL